MYEFGIKSISKVKIMNIKYNRRDYMYKRCTYDEYYSQFLTADNIKYVEANVGRERIINSTDDNFNDIDIRHWDRIVYNLKPLVSDELLILAQEGWSLMTGVCIAKQAARIIWRENNNAIGHQ
jgi:hypothetical protein